MEIINKKIDEIKPYERNAKIHPAKQLKQIAESIKEFGFAQPIVVDKNDVIIVGHGRLEASKLLGMTEVPVLKLDLTEEQAKAYRLADNKLNESDWDMKLVIEELKEISIPMIELTGFDKDLIIETNDKDDQVPELSKEAKTKLGDLYEIGPHKILCGDSTKKEDLEKLMGEVKADMVFSDPPYNVNYKGQGKDTSNHIMNDKMTSDNFDTFLGETMKRFAENSKTGAGWYIFHSSSTQHQFQKAIENAGWQVKNQIIWNKPMAALGWGDYRWKHEPMFYCGKEETVFYGDRTHSTVINIPEDMTKAINWLRVQKENEKKGLTTIWSMKRDNVNEYVHPTQKPVELIIYAIGNSSKRGDIVLDLFLGSGSTIIASEKSERICYGMELDPLYIDVIIQRYCEYTESYKIIKNGKPIDWE